MRNLRVTKSHKNFTKNDNLKFDEAQYFEQLVPSSFKSSFDYHDSVIGNAGNCYKGRNILEM